MEDRLGKKFPNNALSFYTNLYCKRKGKTERKSIVLKEAIKSWISLNRSEKQFFITKYNEYRSNIKESIATHLKNAEPYLQSKEMMHNRNLLQNSYTNNQEADEISLQDTLIASKIENSENEENTKLDVQDFDKISNSTSLINTLLQDEDIIIPEPTPPKIKSAKELFEIIKERDGNDIIWKQLTKQQKKRYQDAILLIKKNYLKQYSLYLESLSSKKLYYHYINTIDCT